MPFSGDSRLNNVEDILYGSFVKMNRMQELTINTFSNTSIAGATELNIFVDLYSVLKPFFSEHYRTVITDNTAITSGIINLCSHYRAFFKRLSVRTKFYLIYSSNCCDINEKFVAGYNSAFKVKYEIPMFNSLAMDNFELLDLLCPYLPDIHFIRRVRGYEVSVIIAHIIQMLHDGNPNLVISKDLYPLQLTYMYPYTSYLFPIKGINGDTSIMLPISEKYNYKESFWNLISHIRKTKLDYIDKISPVNFVVWTALNRFPERSIDMVTNAVGASGIIHKLVGNEDIEVIPQQMYMDEKISQKIPVAKVEARIKALDVKFMLPYYQSDPESKSIKFINLQDPQAVNMINAKFFANNPLDLGKL